MATLFPELCEPQRLFEFPQSLTEKYLPTKIADFAGLSRVKPVLSKVLVSFGIPAEEGDAE